MATRRDGSASSLARGIELEARVLRELAAARRDRDLSGAEVGAAVGLSASQYSRFERGLTAGVPIRQVVGALHAVGLELSVSVHPGGPPIRDAGHARLIDRLRRRCGPSVRVLSEVPLPGPGDPRAWDIVLLGLGWRHHVEAETRPGDLQALERRITLKARDSDARGVSLLLLDSRHNRDFVSTHRATLLARFPVPSSVALASLQAGVDPGAGSVILL